MPAQLTVLLQLSLLCISDLLFMFKNQLCRTLQRGFGAFTFYFRATKNWRRRGKKIQKLGVPREDGTRFAPGNPFYIRSSHTRFTSSISSAEMGLQEIVYHEADEER